MQMADDRRCACLWHGLEHACPGLQHCRSTDSSLLNMRHVLSGSLHGHCTVPAAYACADTSACAAQRLPPFSTATRAAPDGRPRCPRPSQRTRSRPHGPCAAAPAAALAMASTTTASWRQGEAGVAAAAAAGDARRRHPRRAGKRGVRLGAEVGCAGRGAR